jgi:hypothetical protein
MYVPDCGLSWSSFMQYAMCFSTAAGSGGIIYFQFRQNKETAYCTATVYDIRLRRSISGLL